VVDGTVSSVLDGDDDITPLELNPVQRTIDKDVYPLELDVVELGVR